MLVLLVVREISAIAKISGSSKKKLKLHGYFAVKNLTYLLFTLNPKTHFIALTSRQS